MSQRFPLKARISLRLLQEPVLGARRLGRIRDPEELSLRAQSYLAEWKLETQG